MRGEISPVKAPSTAGQTSCAPACAGEAAKASATSAMAVKGANTTTSCGAGCSFRAAATAAAVSRASCRVLYIFQLAAMIFCMEISSLSVLRHQVTLIDQGILAGIGIIAGPFAHPDEAAFLI